MTFCSQLELHACHLFSCTNGGLCNWCTPELLPYYITSMIDSDSDEDWWRLKWLLIAQVQVNTSTRWKKYQSCLSRCFQRKERLACSESELGRRWVLSPRELALSSLQVLDCRRQLPFSHETYNDEKFYLVFVLQRVGARLPAVDLRVHSITSSNWKIFYKTLENYIVGSHLFSEGLFNRDIDFTKSERVAQTVVTQIKFEHAIRSIPLS